MSGTLILQAKWFVTIQRPHSGTEITRSCRLSSDSSLALVELGKTVPTARVDNRLTLVVIEACIVRHKLEWDHGEA